ncbi:DUF2752 domain-containing protein [Ignavibacteria bacterium]|nr:DUF2752 domain-containing protein [Bacteroidota bacterium]MCZ2132757.1 DUF2752 domain-containing protein [Bacteroidota bacterium]
MAARQETEKCAGKTRSLRLAVITSATAIIAVAFVFFANRNPEQGLFIPCFFHKATGLYCPGCGVTRGTWKLLHGDVYGALGANILLPFILGIIGYEIIRKFAKTLFAKELPVMSFGKMTIGLGVIIMIIFTILRNIPKEPFSRLAP